MSRVRRIQIIGLALGRLDQSRAHYRAEAKLLAWVNRSPERREGIRALLAVAALAVWAVVAILLAD